ncbi:MAG: c-type cytochrome, partial [Pseudomonadota bacterium]
PPNVSKQDTHFFNVFSVVLGLLVAFAILMFALARYVGKHEQNAQVLKEPMLQASIEERVSGPRVAVAGQDNSALKIAPVSAGAGAAVQVAYKSGAEVFEAACTACHGTGLLGAPKAGDHAAWAPRIAKGKPTLYEHALKGFSSKPGSQMPAKGGQISIDDDLIKQAVDHMIAM